MIEELEDEVTEMRAIAVRSGAATLKALEEENKKLSAELTDLRSKNEELSRDNSKFINLKIWQTFFFQLLNFSFLQNPRRIQRLRS